WRPGGEGCFTVNTDGSLHRVSNSTAARGLIRDDQGRFILAFASKLGSSIVRAEIWGVIEGMELAWSCGIKQLRVQSDSATAELKSRQWNVTIEHIYREANFAADYLANSGHELDLGTFVFSYPCNGLRKWLRYDMLGVCLPRQFNNML
ncbi:Putative ribonuclease H protein At1g65750, partial [Linum perenne]